MDLLDNNIEHQKPETLLLESFNYWHRKRIHFNILVGISGFLPTLYFSHFHLKLFDLFGCIVWGILANILYSLGYVIESFYITQTDENNNFINYRNILFGLGTGLYMIVSTLFPTMYFIFN